VIRLEEALSDALGMTAHVQTNSKGSGRLTLHFASAEELQGLLQRLSPSRGKGSSATLGGKSRRSNQPDKSGCSHSGLQCHVQSQLTALARNRNLNRVADLVLIQACQ
jgi:hypothetical protein